MTRRKTRREFIRRAIKRHGDKYNYNLTRYKNSRTKVIVICGKHGEFEQTPSAHLSTGGCRLCGVEKNSGDRTLTQEEFLNKLPKERDYEVISEYKKSYLKMRVEDKYGEYRIKASSLIKGAKPTLVSSTNKTNYIKMKSREEHGEKYDYSRIKYKGDNLKIKIVCKKHGEFEEGFTAHMRGKGCAQCSFESRGRPEKDKLDKFKREAKEVHGTLYSYSNTKKIIRGNRVEIICQKHGSFKQDIHSHLNGSGCHTCGRERIASSNRENPTGWKYSMWEEAAKRSDNFDSFKVYIIRCWDKEEEFYKVGKTFRTLKERFPTKHTGVLPYQYKVVKTIVRDSAREVCEVEKEIQREHKEFKYLPKKKFGGRHECFSEISIKEEE